MKKFAFLIVVLMFNILNSQWVQTNGPSWYVAKIYFEGNDIIACDNYKITRSSDDGNTWYDFGTGFSSASVAPNRIFTSISKIGTTWIAVAQNEGIYRSTDSGNTWVFSNTGISTIYVNCSVVKGTDFYVGSNLGIYKSTDNGITWSLNTNTVQSVNTLFVDGNNIYAGCTMFGIFVSSNDGATWVDKSISTYNQFLRNVQCFAKDANYVYAGCSGGGVYRTSNAGTNWTYCNNGNGTYIQELAIDGNTIYSATSVGIYASTNSGDNWTNIQGNLLSAVFTSQGSQVNAVAINNSKVYVGLKDNKVWKRDFSTLSTQNSEISKTQIFPNPFTEILNISSENNGVVQFFDISGKLVATEKLSKGSNSFNKSSLKSGVYIYKIKNTNGETISSGKVIKQ